MVDCQKWSPIPPIAICMPSFSMMLQLFYLEVETLSLEADLGHVTCLGQWVTSKHNLRSEVMGSIQALPVSVEPGTQRTRKLQATKFFSPSKTLTDCLKRSYQVQRVGNEWQPGGQDNQFHPSAFFSKSSLHLSQWSPLWLLMRIICRTLSTAPMTVSHLQDNLN